MLGLLPLPCLALRCPCLALPSLFPLPLPRGRVRPTAYSWIVEICHVFSQEFLCSIQDCKNRTGTSNSTQPSWDIAGALQAYKEGGVPASQMNFGLATYGRSMTATGKLLPGEGIVSGVLDSSTKSDLSESRQQT